MNGVGATETLKASDKASLLGAKFHVPRSHRPVSFQKVRNAEIFKFGEFGCSCGIR